MHVKFRYLHFYAYFYNFSHQITSLNTHFGPLLWLIGCKKINAKLFFLKVFAFMIIAIVYLFFSILTLLLRLLVFLPKNIRFLGKTQLKCTNSSCVYREKVHKTTKKETTRRHDIIITINTAIIKKELR